MLPFGVAMVVASIATGEPGAMDTGFGLFYGSGMILASVVGLGWTLLRLRGSTQQRRRKARRLISVTTMASALLFGYLSISGIDEDRRQDRALEATATWRFDFGRDLADAYRTWYANQGGTDAIYTGDYYEWWSLDPDRDGEPNSGAPIVRMLDDLGWAERGVRVFDIDDDLVIDGLEWIPPSQRGTSVVWCVPIALRAKLYVAVWSEAVPHACAPGVIRSGDG